eukprot:12088747-Prorocentrum_lima.AAC.1
MVERIEVALSWKREDTCGLLGCCCQALCLRQPWRAVSNLAEVVLVALSALGWRMQSATQLQ